MRIELWLDYMCPISYVVHKNLEKIIRKNNFQNLEIWYRSFDMAKNFDFTNKTVKDVLCYHRNISEIELKKYSVINKYLNIKAIDVTIARKISHLAKKKGVAFNYHQLLFEAIYEEKMDISNLNNLINIAQECSISKDEVMDAISSDKITKAIEVNIENALLKGITKVPHIRINGKIKIEGYQSYDQLLKIMLCADANLITELYCTDDYCQRKRIRR